MRRGEIYLAQFPFGDAPGMKLRPVLLLTEALGPIPEVLVAYISSVIPSQSIPSDLLVDPARPDFRTTNLKTKSALRLSVAVLVFVVLAFVRWILLPFFDYSFGL